MPLKKTEWGDVPHIEYVKERDVFGTWIQCGICDVKIRIRSQFCFTEWEMHCSGVKHCKLANSKALKDLPKIETFFKKRTACNKISTRATLSSREEHSIKKKKIEFLPWILLWEEHRFVTSLRQV